jgi:hypothetical protein
MVKAGFPREPVDFLNSLQLSLFQDDSVNTRTEVFDEKGLS